MKREFPTLLHGASMETRSRRRVTIVSSVTEDRVVKSGDGRATRGCVGAISTKSKIERMNLNDWKGI